MAKLTKRQRAFAERIEEGKLYAIDEAVSILNELSTVKFKESIDVSINLGVDPRKSDQVVRGATVLPNGTGKDIRVAVFAQGDKADEATAAGADIVGMEKTAIVGGGDTASAVNSFGIAENMTPKGDEMWAKLTEEFNYEFLSSPETDITMQGNPIEIESTDITNIV